MNLRVSLCVGPGALDAQRWLMPGPFAWINEEGILRRTSVYSGFWLTSYGIADDPAAEGKVRIYRSRDLGRDYGNLFSGSYTSERIRWPDSGATPTLQWVPSRLDIGIPSACLIVAYRDAIWGNECTCLLEVNQNGIMLWPTAGLPGIAEHFSFDPDGFLRYD